MKHETFIDRDATRINSFGALRLILAAAVIVSHMYPVLYGHRTGELGSILTRGQVDLGALAVQMFFAISGYLIALSWMRTPKLSTFMMKRCLRIYPGFIVASLVSLLIVAPLAGAQFPEAWTLNEVIKSLGRLVLLGGPKLPGSFAGEPFEVLNMSLWTIRYEFICYLLVPLIVWAVTRTRRSVVLALYIMVLGWHAAQGGFIIDEGIGRGAGSDLHIHIIGSPDVWPRFLVYFLGGMVLAYYRHTIPYNIWLFGLALSSIAVTSYLGQGLYLAMATGGIYALFFIAYQRLIPTHTIGVKWDYSYGVYLYGWPVQALIAQNLRGTLGEYEIYWMVLMSLVGVTILAALSWYLIEAPCLREKAKLARKASDESDHPTLSPVTATEPAPVVGRDPGPRSVVRHGSDHLPRSGSTFTGRAAS